MYNIYNSKLKVILPPKFMITYMAVIYIFVLESPCL